MTAPASPPKPSPRRGRARRSAQFESSRRSRRADAQNGHRGRRRRNPVGGANPADGAVGDIEDSVVEVVDGAHGRGGARGRALERGRGCGEGVEGVKEDGSATEAQGTGAAGDRSLCEHVSDHYERFRDAERTTTAFPPLGGGGSSERARAPWLRADLWHVFTFACTSGCGCGLSQQELRRLYRFTKQVEAARSASRMPFTAAFHNDNRLLPPFDGSNALLSLHSTGKRL